MFKPLNLKQYMEIFETKNPELIKSCINVINHNYENKNNDLKKMEAHDLEKFSKILVKHASNRQMEGYLIGFKPELGFNDDFDILRFSKGKVLNIELKHEIPKSGLEGMLNQLRRHKRIISTLNNLDSEEKIKEIIEYVFVSNNGRDAILYKLINNNLIISNFDSLVEDIDDEYLIYNRLIDIDPTALMVSPYSEASKFASHEYYLNDNQKNGVIKLLKSKKEKLAIIGQAGTGKTLVLLEIAKEFIKKGKKVLLIFTGKLENYQEVSIAFGFDVLPIKIAVQIKAYEDYDIILFDEFQRIDMENWRTIKKIENKIFVFSIDDDQTLHPTEKGNMIENKVKKDASVEWYELTEKIRTDPRMASFIYKFTNLNKKIKYYYYNRVFVEYFNDEDIAIEYVDFMCKENGYVSIEFSEYITKSNFITKRKNIYNKSLMTHDVIGREYDNVLIIIDKHIYHNKDGKITSTYNEFYPYLEESCLFEALTRVRRNLMLVIINNPQMYITVQKILTQKEEIY